MIIIIIMVVIIIVIIIITIIKIRKSDENPNNGSNNCHCSVPSAIWEIFSELLLFCKLRGKYFPILYKATYDNYFIVKCLLKSNVSESSYLLIVSSLLIII